jgi:hypothetical protein
VPQSLRYSRITTIALVPNFVFITFPQKSWSHPECCEWANHVQQIIKLKTNIFYKPNLNLMPQILCVYYY